MSSLKLLDKVVDKHGVVQSVHVGYNLKMEVAKQGMGMTARVARQVGGSPGFLSFHLWGHSVAALKWDGTKLWVEAGGDGIDDVWAADQGLLPAVAWATRGGGADNLLLVAIPAAVNAFQVKPPAASPRNTRP